MCFEAARTHELRTGPARGSNDGAYYDSVPHLPNRASIRHLSGLMLGVGLVGMGLGVLTAYAQAWLPEQVGSLANSSGPWCLIAVLLALLATSQLTAAGCGVLALVTLLAGYVVGAASRGYSSSTSLIGFWGLAALLVGPFLGLGAHWVKSKRPILSALAAGGISGLLVGEGVYGLAYIADSTYPPYWWTEVIVGVTLLIWTAIQRLRRPHLVALAAGLNLLVTAAFLVITQLDLIAFFP